MTATGKKSTIWVVEYCGQQVVNEGNLGWLDIQAGTKTRKRPDIIEGLLQEGRKKMEEREEASARRKPDLNSNPTLTTP